MRRVSFASAGAAMAALDAGEPVAMRYNFRIATRPHMAWTRQRTSWDMLLDCKARARAVAITVA
jgi:hypothetical protein